MPFHLAAVAGGYKVQDDKGKFYSDKPLARGAAVRQMRALYANIPEASQKSIDPNVGGGVDRSKLSAGDFVDPERRRFPIVKPGDVSDAVSSYGRANPKIPFDQFKARVMAICRRKGPAFMAALPESWKTEEKEMVTEKHLPGKHNQSSHGQRGGGSLANAAESVGGQMVSQARSAGQDIQERVSRVADMYRQLNNFKPSKEYPSKITLFRSIGQEVSAINAARKKINDLEEQYSTQKESGKKEGNPISEIAAKADALISKMMDLEGMDDILAENENEKEFSSLSVFKDKNGDYRWVLFSSNAYKDLDREFISTKAIEQDVERSDQAAGDPPDYGPLRWWHVKNIDIGTCDFRTTSPSGRTLIESGTFRTKSIGMKVAQAAPRLQVSIGFNHPITEPDRDGIYHNISTFERSLLPRGRAANAHTFVFVKGDDPMASKEEKLKALQALLGDDADSIIQQAAAVEKSLDQSGVAFKESETLKHKGSAPHKHPHDAMGEGETPEEEAGESPEEEAGETPEEESSEPANKKKKEAGDETDPIGEDNYYLDDEIPVIGNMPVADYEAMIRVAVADALAPVVKELKETLKELGQPASADPAAKSSHEVALEATVKQLEGNLKKMAAQLKELQGETPRAAKGFRASESPETLIDDEKVKELGVPTQDPFVVSFVNDLLGSSPRS